ncbi:Chitin synthase, class 1, partial [Serendipita sp. 407]
MALLGTPGGRGGDRMSVGGFNPDILGEDDDAAIRYGRIPQRVPRRYKTKKRYELFHGNLVIDNEVPSKLLDMCIRKDDREFKFMRYTAATCDPNDFKKEGYTLRPAMYDPARKTELFIVMTMYNEDEELFCRTMSGVMKNIQHLITRERSKTWGKEGWKKVVVCIVSDGRSKINARTLSVIASMGCYQDGVAKNAVNGKPVTAHIYEYTSQISVTPSVKIGPQKENAPIQLIFCLKEKNQKKINSHRWFFNAFGPVLEPNVCVLLDKYFLGEKMHGAGADIFTANMYLAEDRILCWELVSKRRGQWILHYVKSAYAETDVPDEVPELISQRRRWLNGSFFAAVHSTVKFGYIYRSSHTAARKFWIHVELVYQTFNLIFSWFSLGNYYIAFYILSNAMEDKSFGIAGIKVINLVLNYMYLGLLVTCYLLALGNRPQGSKKWYTIAFIGFGIVTIYMTFSAFFLAFRGISDIASQSQNGTLTFGDFFTNSIFRNIVVSLLATLGLYIFASLLFFEPWHMITSFVQYLLMAPSYIAVLNVYAFANVHDVSWGTKGDNKVATDLGTVSAAGKNKNEVEVVVPTEQKDINAA